MDDGMTWPMVYGRRRMIDARIGGLSCDWRGRWPVTDDRNGSLTMCDTAEAEAAETATVLTLYVDGLCSLYYVVLGGNGAVRCHAG